MKIFISYRRAEDNKTWIVGTIHEKLAEVFGTQNVFRDNYGISAGDDWRSVLNQEINKCNVILVIIGPDWVSLELPNGEKRLFDPDDVTRWEVETGLQRSNHEKTTVIPVLVMDAELPKANDLPKSLIQLLDKHAVRLRNYPDFNKDIENLIRDIRLSHGYAEEDISTKYFEPKTIYIAEGSFWMGSQPGERTPSHEPPRHEVNLPAYRIGKYPVTNSQYEKFIGQEKILVSPIMGWDGQQVPSGLENHPVTGVTWYEARAYCDWLAETTDLKYSLPNEAQWEKACRGGGNTFYPWGDEFDPQRCNYGQQSVASVDKYPAQNEFGGYDFVGNVLQWTCTLWGKKRFPPDPQFSRYPWEDDGRNNLNANREIRRVVRGSTMGQDIISHRCSARSGQAPEERGGLGTRFSFRVVMNL